MLLKLLRRALVLFVGLFLVLEAVLWIFVRVPPEPLKNVDLKNDIPGLKRDVRFSFDAHVARYLDGKNGSKPAGVYRILCLGGSGTLAMLQNAEDTWWGQLGRMLQKEGLPVEVAAWGREKTPLLSATPVAAELIESWHPDLVIGNFGFDDVVCQPLHYKYDAGKAGRLPPQSRPSGWKDAILKISQTARFWRLWARNNEASTLQNTIGRPDYYKDIFAAIKQKIGAGAFHPPLNRSAPDDPLQEYLDGWKILETLARRQGAAFLMTGEPSLDDSTNNHTQAENLMALIQISDGAPGGKVELARPDPAWVEQEMRRYAEAAEGFAAEVQAPWLDLNGRVPRSTDHFFSDVLLTDAGAEAAARELLPVVSGIVKSKAGK